MYNPQPFHTADGVELKPGMEVWVIVQSDDWNQPPRPESRVVGTISPNGKKVIFSDESGWRVDGVFSNRDSAVNHIYNSKVHLDLSEDDAEAIHYCLCQRLGEAQFQLGLLRIANDRELTKAERRMLPFQLCRYTREELAEQIDPWITLVSNYEYLIKDVEEALAKLEK